MTFKIKTWAISDLVNACIDGRQILNVVLVGNEAVDSILRSNRGAILCKLDVEKAYDIVSGPLDVRCWKRCALVKSG